MNRYYLVGLLGLILLGGCKTENKSKESAVHGPAKLETSQVPSSNTAKESELNCPEGSQEIEVASKNSVGRLRCCQTSDGTKHGSCSYHDSEKGLRGKFGFHSGKPHGRWTMYKGKHELIETGFDHGQADGKWAGWYDDGTQMTVASFKAGKQHGIWQNFYDNGQKAKQAQYKVGELIGPILFWDRQGKSISEKEFQEGIKSPVRLDTSVFDVFR